MSIVVENVSYLPPFRKKYVVSSARLAGTKRFTLTAMWMNMSGDTQMKKSGRTRGVCCPTFVWMRVGVTS